MESSPASPWDRPQTVEGFVRSLPNATLIHFADHERQRAGGGWVLDLGCGAGRNAVPLAQLGWHVLGIDNSEPMLKAARQRTKDEQLSARLHVAFASMDRLPVRDGSCGLIVAHGIWNLARSSAEFRQAVAEAARAAKPDAALFVFTFSRHTLPAEAEPVAGEPFVFTQFSGQPQCFLTEEQLRTELAAAGFTPDPHVPLRELNRPRPGTLTAGRTPVIYEGVFRKNRVAADRPDI